MRKALLRIIDFLYPPFSGWLSLHTFRYMAAGGSTAVCGIISYYIAYNWILHQKNFEVAFLFLPKLITGHSLALVISTFSSFLWGFTLNKYLVFNKSTLKEGYRFSGTLP